MLWFDFEVWKQAELLGGIKHCYDDGYQSILSYLQNFNYFFKKILISHNLMTTDRCEVNNSDYLVILASGIYWATFCSQC